MPSVTASLIQTHTHWHDPVANRAMFDIWLQDVPTDADLVVLPEMFSTGFTMASSAVAETMRGDTVTWLMDTARSLGKTLCGSVVIEDAGRYFNRLLWVGPDGAVQHYDKRHLFRMAGETNHYTAGDRRVIVELNGLRICLAVCYDLRFPVWLRNRDDYDVLLVVANWPAARVAAWMTLLRARAIENLSYVVGVNILGTDGAGVEYTGGSAVYDAEGRAVLEPSNKAEVATVVLDLGVLAEYRAAFPAWRDADDFELEV